MEVWFCGSLGLWKFESLQVKIIVVKYFILYWKMFTLYDRINSNNYKKYLFTWWVRFMEEMQPIHWYFKRYFLIALFQSKSILFSFQNVVPEFPFVMCLTYILTITYTYIYIYIYTYILYILTYYIYLYTFILIYFHTYIL